MCTKYKIDGETLKHGMSDIDSFTQTSTPQVSFEKDSFRDEEFYFVAGKVLSNQSFNVRGEDVLDHGQKCTWVMRNCVFVKIDANGDFEVKDKAKPGEVKTVNFEKNESMGHGTQYNWIHTYVKKSLPNNPVPRYIMYTYAKTPVEMEDHRINVIDEKIYSAVSFEVILTGGGSANMDDPLRYLHPLPNA